MHGLGGLAVYNNTAVIIAGLNNTSGNTEIYETRTATWKTVSKGTFKILFLRKISFLRILRLKLKNLNYIGRFKAYHWMGQHMHLVEFIAVEHNPLFRVLNLYQYVNLNLRSPSTERCLPRSSNDKDNLLHEAWWQIWMESIPTRNALYSLFCWFDCQK